MTKHQYNKYKLKVIFPSYWTAEPFKQIIYMKNM